MQKCQMMMCKEVCIRGTRVESTASAADLTHRLAAKTIWDGVHQILMMMACCQRTERMGEWQLRVAAWLRWAQAHALSQMPQPPATSSADFVIIVNPLATNIPGCPPLSAAEAESIRDVQARLDTTSELGPFVADRNFTYNSQDVEYIACFQNDPNLNSVMWVSPEDAHYFSNFKKRRDEWIVQVGDERPICRLVGGVLANWSEQNEELIAKALEMLPIRKCHRFAPKKYMQAKLDEIPVNIQDFWNDAFFEVQEELHRWRTDTRYLGSLLSDEEYDQLLEEIHPRFQKLAAKIWIFEREKMNGMTWKGKQHMLSWISWITI